ncbi:MAG: HIT family protein [Herpetosiphon sp.]
MFCRIVAGTIPAEIVYQDADVVAFLDIMPVTRGHTLVIPRTHAVDIFDLDPAVLAATATKVQVVARLLHDRLNSDGMNVFQNNRAAAGQEVFHYHVHLLPRWSDAPDVRLGRRQTTTTEELAQVAAQIRS